MRVTRLPVWIYGAIASIPALILVFFWSRLDAGSRLELVIPLIVWTLLFAAIGWARLHETRLGMRYRPRGPTTLQAPRNASNAKGDT